MVEKEVEMDDSGQPTAHSSDEEFWDTGEGFRVACAGFGIQSSVSKI